MKKTKASANVKENSATMGKMISEQTISANSIGRERDQNVNSLTGAMI